MAGEALGQAGRGDAVDLVEHHQHRLVGHAQFVEHHVHRLDLFLRLRRTDIHDMQQQVGLDDLLERRLESIDQVVRQLADEPHRVGEQHVLIGRQAQPPRGRVEGGEQLVLGERRGAGDGVEKRRLAGVGVADQRA